MDNSEIDFQELHYVYRPKILRYLKRLVGEHEAEDLTQDVFLRINQALKDFKGECKLSTWIYRIATNAAIDKLRSPAFKKSVQRTHSRTQVHEIEEEVEDNDIWTGQKPLSMDEVLVKKEMKECFQEFINKLPLDHRTVFILSDLKGLTDKEIAKQLGVSLATIKIRLHRGRAGLRREIQAHCGLVRDARNGLLWEGKRP